MVSPDDVPAAQRVELGRGRGPGTARAFVLVALGGVLGGATFAMLARRLVAPGSDLDASLQTIHPALVGGGALFGALVALALFALPRALKQPGGARVTWDDWGVVEWDGRRVRTAMPWSTLGTATVDVLYRRRGQTRGSPAGQVIVLTDERRERIVVARGGVSLRGAESWRVLATDEDFRRLSGELIRRGVPARAVSSIALPGARRYFAFELLAFAAGVAMVVGLRMEATGVYPADGAAVVLAGAAATVVGLLGGALELMAVLLRARAPVVPGSTSPGPRGLEREGRRARAAVRAAVIASELVARGVVAAAVAGCAILGAR